MTIGPFQCSRTQSMSSQVIEASKLRPIQPQNSHEPLQVLGTAAATVPSVCGPPFSCTSQSQAGWVRPSSGLAEALGGGVGEHAGAHVAIAGAGHRQVDGEDQHRATARGGAGQHVGHEAAVLEHVELEPGRLRSLGHLVDVADGRRVERRNGTPAAFAAVAACASPRRAYMPAMPTGAEHHRHGERLAEQLGLSGELGDVAQHPLAQLQRLDVGDVGAPASPRRRQPPSM